MLKFDANIANLISKPLAARLVSHKFTAIGPGVSIVLDQISPFLVAAQWRSEVIWRPETNTK